MKRFNVAGPCRPDLHYMLPAAARLPEAPGLVEEHGYFVVHAPRQTGKTTAIRAIAEELTASGRYAALAFSCQTAGAAGDDVALAQQRLLSEVRSRGESALPPELRLPNGVEDPSDPLRTALAAWARSSPLPVLLFLDEIDSLVGESLTKQRSVPQQRGEIVVIEGGVVLPFDRSDEANGVRHGRSAPTTSTSTS